LTVTNRCQHTVDWPGLQQVCRLERTVCCGQEPSTTVAFAITSLPRRKAGARRLLQMWRRHWHIENRSHYVRDVTLGEDACRVRSGHAPQLLAALRNAVVSLLHARRAGNLAAALRNLAWCPLQAAHLVGVSRFP